MCKCVGSERSRESARGAHRSPIRWTSGKNNVILSSWAEQSLELLPPGAKRQGAAPHSHVVSGAVHRGTWQSRPVVGDLAYGHAVGANPTGVVIALPLPPLAPDVVTHVTIANKARSSRGMPVLRSQRWADTGLAMPRVPLPPRSS